MWFWIVRQLLCGDKKAASSPPKSFLSHRRSGPSDGVSSFCGCTPCLGLFLVLGSFPCVLHGCVLVLTIYYLFDFELFSGPQWDRSLKKRTYLLFQQSLFSIIRLDRPKTSTLLKLINMYRWEADRSPHWNHVAQKVDSTFLGRPHPFRSLLNTLLRCPDQEATFFHCKFHNCWSRSI